MGPRPLQLRSSTRRLFWWRRILRSRRLLSLAHPPRNRSARSRARASRRTFRRGRWSGATSSTSPPVAPTQPNPAIWTYDTGNSGFGNSELETYCAWGSTTSPCSTASPSAYVGPYTERMGFCISWRSSRRPRCYTSARLKTQGLFSFQYGRIEFRAQVPESQGFWPADWLLGNNIATVNWPACGEQDVQERINAPGSPDWNAGLHSRAGLHRRQWTRRHVLLSQRSDGRRRVSYLRHDLVAGARVVFHR